MTPYFHFVAQKFPKCYKKYSKIKAKAMFMLKILNRKKIEIFIGGITEIDG